MSAPGDPRPLTGRSLQRIAQAITGALYSCTEEGLEAQRAAYLCFAFAAASGSTVQRALLAGALGGLANHCLDENCPPEKLAERCESARTLLSVAAELLRSVR